MSTQESKCPVNGTKQKLEFFYHDDTKNGMCSKCHPCKLGIYDAIKILDTIQAGGGETRHVALLRRIAHDVRVGSMCKKGKDHADILSEFLTIHAEDICRHVKGICDDHECKALVTYEIKADRCTMCDQCSAACPSFAIEGQKREPYKTGFTPYRIRQRRCTNCGECLAVCPEGAVFISDNPGVRVPKRNAGGVPVAQPAHDNECIDISA